MINVFFNQLVRQVQQDTGKFFIQKTNTSSVIMTSKI